MSSPQSPAMNSGSRKQGRCPICEKPARDSFRPFCSKHCADVDLSRWLNGRYAIPVVEEDGGIDADEFDESGERPPEG